MPDRKPDTWTTSTSLARAILYDRAERRRWLGRMTLLPLGMIAVGLWLIDAWLWASPWRAIVWWGACGLATLVVILFAIYDALAVIREERAKNRRGDD
jgi:ABC-type antimicrobial peptide transport system permease subunit